MAGSLDIEVNGYFGADFCSENLSLEQCHRAVGVSTEIVTA
jgi:hypothetical protein